MKVTRSRICLAGLVSAVAVAILPLNAAEERPKDDQLQAIVYPVADLPVWMCKSDTFNPTLLIAHLKLAVDPDSWERGSISIHEATASLVIWQTRANHQKIGDFLTTFRRDVPGEQRQVIFENGVIRTLPPNPAQPDR